MAKRQERRPDAERTELLGLDELFVMRGRGDQNNYYVWSYDAKAGQCPLCKSERIKNHGLFSKSYYDLIEENGRPHVIKLNYDYYKFLCLEENCGHVFVKETDFASKNDNVTHRLEDAIAKKIIAGYSFGMIEDYLQGNLSRQAIGQIFHRWVANHETYRSARWTPQQLVILSGKTDKERYTLFLALDDGIRIFDILYGVNSEELHSTLKKLDPNRVITILTDCDPIINDAVHSSFPNALHIIPVELWLHSASEDYQAFARDKIRWCQVPHKESLIMIPRSRITYSDEYTLGKLLEARPGVKPTYEDYSRLRGLIERRGELWVYEELMEWADSVCEDTRDYMAPSLYLLQAYRSEIEAQTQHRDAVPARLAVYTAQLEWLLLQAKTFSADVLKARTLYSVDTDLQNWRGVPIEDVIRALNGLKNIDKRKRSDFDEYQ